MTKVILTHEGKIKLQEELRLLVLEEKPRLFQEISDAKDRGGVSENAEYDIAREQFSRLQDKILKLEQTISNSTIVSLSDIDTDQVSVLSTVKVFNRTTKGEMKFTIVPETDINIKVGKISLNSPIAVGLLGKKVGDITKVVIPAGTIEFEILEITV